MVLISLKKAETAVLEQNESSLIIEEANEKHRRASFILEDYPF